MRDNGATPRALHPPSWLAVVSCSPASQSRGLGQGPSLDRPPWGSDARCLPYFPTLWLIRAPCEVNHIRGAFHVFPCLSAQPPGCTCQYFSMVLPSGFYQVTHVIHSPVEGHPGWFWYLAIKFLETLTDGISAWAQVSFSLWSMPESEIAGLCGGFTFSVISHGRTVVLSSWAESRWHRHACRPVGLHPRWAWRGPAFWFRHFDMCVVIVHCDFNLCFPNG